MKAAIEASLRESNKSNHQSHSLKGDTDDDGSELETFDSDTEAPSTSNTAKPVMQRPDCLENGLSTGVASSSTHASNASCSAMAPAPSSISNTSSSVVDWTEYLGPDDGKYSELIIRYPDGSREQMSFPAESKLKARFISLLYFGDILNCCFLSF